MPNYNRGKYIGAAVESVLKQSIHDWELIIVDDASTDDSWTVISSFQDPRIRKIRLPENGHVSNAHNVGNALCEGQYIALLDSDDLWERDKLEKQIAFMEKTGAAFSFHAYEFGDESARPTGKIVHVPKTLTFKQALSQTIIFTTTVMFDTEKIDMEIIHMPQVPSEDTATWWRILKYGHTAYGLDENLAIYRRPPKSLSSNKIEAIRRIWFLYRNIANLSVAQSLFYFGGWAVRATLRRL